MPRLDLQTLFGWLSLAVLLLIFLILPVSLVFWELATGHVRNSVTGRRKRWHFRLKTMFVAIASFGMLFTIWRNFEEPAAAGITVAAFVGGPLLYLFLGDLFQRRKAAQHLLGPDEQLVNDPMVQQSLQEVGEQQSPSSAERLHSSAAPDKKWWARRWAAFQFGRYGTWR